MSIRNIAVGESVISVEKSKFKFENPDTKKWEFGNVDAWIFRKIRGSYITELKLSKEETEALAKLVIAITGEFEK